MASGGLRALIKAVSNLEGRESAGSVRVVVRLIRMGILAIPLTVFLLLVWPFLDVRFRPIYADRLGHLVLETDLFISQLERDGTRVLVLCFFVGGPANSFFAELIQEKVKVVSPVLGATGFFLQGTIFGRSYPRFPASLQQTREKLTKQTAWVSDGLSRSKLDSLLTELGADPNCPYVCLWVRDSVYGANAMPGTDQYFAEYRNAKVENYHLMCRTLKSQGYSVIRMGRSGIIEGAEHELPYLDYISSSANTEENDFLLAKFCSFAICGDSGSTSIPLLYRRPIALANIGSFIGAISAESIRILAMKRIEWIENGNPVKTSEMKRFGIHKFNDTSQFDAIGIRHVENSDRQLESLALDMLHLLEKDPDGNAPVRDRGQILFREKVRPLLEEEPAFLAGTVWLEENPQFLQ